MKHGFAAVACCCSNASHALNAGSGTGGFLSDSHRSTEGELVALPSDVSAAAGGSSSLGASSEVGMLFSGGSSAGVGMEKKSLFSMGGITKSGVLPRSTGVRLS
jgi:hypothetical protein